MIKEVGTFWTRGRVICAAIGVVITVGSGLIAQGRWSERLTQAVESISMGHSQIERRLNRLFIIVEGHMSAQSHTHQAALNKELRALASSAVSRVDDYIAADKQTEQRWFNIEWPEHLEMHRDIEQRLRTLERINGD